MNGELVLMIPLWVLVAGGLVLAVTLAVWVAAGHIVAMDPGQHAVWRWRGRARRRCRAYHRLSPDERRIWRLQERHQQVAA